MTNSFSIETVEEQRGPGFVLWGLLLVFAAANFLPLFPYAFPPVLYSAGQIVPAAIFALVHCTRVYRFRGAMIFTLISLATGYLMEFIGVHTGFPFGHYYFTDQMGPKLFAVPILMGPAYVGMGYVSWTVARIILSHENEQSRPSGPRLLALPVVASFAMVAWNLAFDPALSTFGHYWVWLDGGAYFGVPISNFLGWLLTNYLIYQLFALYLRSRSAPNCFFSPADQRLAVTFYAICAAGCVLRAASIPSPAVMADPTGTLWHVRDINNVCALAGIFVMGPFVAIAATKLIGRSWRNRRPDFGVANNRREPAKVAPAHELERVP